jgi:hypothetical protein
MAQCSALSVKGTAPTPLPRESFGQNSLQCFYEHKASARSSNKFHAAVLCLAESFCSILIASAVEKMNNSILHPGLSLSTSSMTGRLP